MLGIFTFQFDQAARTLVSSASGPHAVNSLLWARGRFTPTSHKRGRCKQAVLLVYRKSTNLAENIVRCDKVKSAKNSFTTTQLTTLHTVSVLRRVRQGPSAGACFGQLVVSCCTPCYNSCCKATPQMKPCPSFLSTSAMAP